MLRSVVVLALLMVPGIAAAQSMDSRLSELQRSINALSQQLEQLKVQDQQLQQRLEKMQQSFEQRIDRLEKRPAAPTPRTGRSKH